MQPPPTTDPLADFHPIVRDWFTTTLGEPASASPHAATLREAGFRSMGGSLRHYAPFR